MLLSCSCLHLPLNCVKISTYKTVTILVCVRACVHVRARARVRARVYVCVCVCVCFFEFYFICNQSHITFTLRKGHCPAVNINQTIIPQTEVVKYQDYTSIAG